jgi:hypothetical protein
MVCSFPKIMPDRGGLNMLKRFEQTENGYAIVVDRSTLELLGIDPEIPFELTSERGGLFLSPIHAHKDHEARVEVSTIRMATIHRESLEKLAQ